MNRRSASRDRASPGSTGGRIRRSLSSIVFATIVLAIAPRGGSAQIVADHRAVGAFDSIPEEVLPRTAELRFLFRHASVGGTIDGALDCLQGTRDHPAECTAFPDYRYDRRAWDFQARGNSGWYAKVDDFAAQVEAQLDAFDVFAFKYCYLDGLDGLMEPCGGPLDPAKVERAWSYLRTKMEGLEAAHPDKIFIWWTIPLTQVGQECTEVLNARIRQYVRENRKMLFDIADIESHDDLGAHQTNGQGWEVAIRAFCGEQKPDAQACHPNWTGSLRLAKALWWLLARATGWDGGAGPVSFVRGDANGDGAKDITDVISILSHLFLGDPEPGCLESADSNDDGSVDVSDAVRLVGHLFQLGWPIPDPAAACGSDPTEDGLSCASFGPCRQAP